VRSKIGSTRARTSSIGLVGEHLEGHVTLGQKLLDTRPQVVDDRHEASLFDRPVVQKKAEGEVRFLCFAHEHRLEEVGPTDLRMRLAPRLEPLDHLVRGCFSGSADQPDLWRLLRLLAT
jgi:hypothetical protein